MRALLVVDNTFASPYLQQPLALGADVVVHSTTKYLGGHSDVVGGALVIADAELREELAFHQNAMGAVAGPFDAWLVLRGIKTLGVRMDRHCANAERVASYLRRPPGGRAGATTPGCRDHPGHEIAAGRCAASAAWCRSRVRGRRGGGAARCARLTSLFTLGESLGGVESLIEHPGRMTHASRGRLAAGGARRPRPAVRGHRGCRRPHRRPRPGIELAAHELPRQRRLGRPGPRL